MVSIFTAGVFSKSHRLVLRWNKRSSFNTIMLDNAGWSLIVSYWLSAGPNESKFMSGAIWTSVARWAWLHTNRDHIGLIDSLLFSCCSLYGIGYTLGSAYIHNYSRWYIVPHEICPPGSDSNLISWNSCTLFNFTICCIITIFNEYLYKYQV